ncbi:hypothetical protein [Anaerosporobacter sp.]
MIDNYFQETLGIKKDDIDKKKYKAWLTLCGKDDTVSSLEEFKEFMLHEMQHIEKRALNNQDS